MNDTAHTEIDRVCNAIYQAIFERRLEPNTRLVESQLAKALSTSRANARQALLLLAQKKLVTIALNKGAVVADPSRTEALEIFAARRCIEREIVQLVFQRCNAEDIDALRLHVEEEQLARQDQDHFELIRATGKFHLLLAKIAGNKVLLDFMEQLIAHSSLILEKFETHDMRTCQENDHSEMINLIEDGQLEEGLKLIDKHLIDLEQVLNFKEKFRPANLTEVFAPLLDK
ncbi:MAG: GntR family transcriptional regulator [Desulfofustis sp.]|nr:GntR family transcriptional regulator [Desulfofustis sp.]